MTLTTTQYEDKDDIRTVNAIPLQLLLMLVKTDHPNVDLHTRRPKALYAKYGS